MFEIYDIICFGSVSIRRSLIRIERFGNGAANKILAFRFRRLSSPTILLFIASPIQTREKWLYMHMRAYTEHTISRVITINSSKLTARGTRYSLASTQISIEIWGYRRVAWCSRLMLVRVRSANLWSDLLSEKHYTYKRCVQTIVIRFDTWLRYYDVLDVLEI
jgi:hypothetical protein